jgi:hypothetical protein
MKKFYFSALILFFVLATGYAQNYRMLNRNSEYYFTGNPDPFNNDLVYGLKCDSVNGNATDTSYYPYRTIAAVLPPDSGCNVDPDYPIWAGKEIFIDANGNHHWTTFQGDSVIINSQTSAGDTQVIYTYANADRIIAIHAYDSLKTFANITDSVKIYLLQTLDPSDAIVTSWWNNKQVVISKNNGVVKMPSILNFPTDTFMFSRVAAKRLTYGDCYPWQPGDELQENENSYHFQSMWYYYTFYNKYILSRTMINADSVVFTIKRVRHYVSNAPPANTISTDTITLSVGRLNSLIETKMPQQTIDSVRTYDLYLSSYDCGKIRMVDHIMNENYIFSPGCIQQNTFEPAFYDNIYVEGVAGYYYHDYPSALNNGTQSTYDFSYYSMGNVSCGNPLYIGIDEQVQTEFKAWPNPVTDQLNLDLPANFSGTILIRDLSGKEIRELPLTPGNAVDIRSLADGFYIGSFIAADGTMPGYFRFVKSGE